MNERTVQDARRAIGLIPCGMWVMTSAFEGRRAGVIVKSVSPCADEPMLLAVAAWKGHGIEPIIRDSHHFAVSLIEPEDRLLVRKFSGHLADQPEQFDTIATERLISGSPLLTRSRLGFDCEVIRHFDMEADHELYIGLVLGARVGAPRAAVNGHAAPNGTQNGHGNGSQTNGHAGGPTNGHAGGHVGGHPGSHTNGHAPHRHGPQSA